MAETLVYPEDIRSGFDSPAWIRFNFYDRLDPTAKSKSDTVCVYMPESVSQPSTVSWGPEKFGFIGNQIANAGRNMIQNYNSGEGGFAGHLAAMSAAGKSVWNGADLAGAANLGAARGLSSAGSMFAQLSGGQVTADQLMGEVTGKIPNPYLTMIFEGVNFRNFAFTFKFYPFEEADCDRIDQIIKAFRKHSLPEYQGERNFLGYPSECQIEYMWQDDKNPWLHAFKPAVCTAVDVDYTAAGMFSVMRNGFPSEIVVSTKWSEIQIVTRKDIDEGF